MKMRNKIYMILDGRVALQNILFVLKKCEIYLRHAPIFIFYGNHKPENLYFSCIYILLCSKFYDSMVEWSIKVFLQNIKHCQHASSRFDNCIHAIKLFMTKATTVEPHINHFWKWANLNQPGCHYIILHLMQSMRYYLMLRARFY